MGDSAREYHQKQAKSLIPLMKLPLSMIQEASQNNALRLNEINHLRSDSYRVEYRRDRPEPEPMSGAASCHFPYFNIRPTGLALARAARRQFQRMERIV